VEETPVPSGPVEGGANPNPPAEGTTADDKRDEDEENEDEQG